MGVACVTYCPLMVARLRGLSLAS